MSITSNGFHAGLVDVSFLREWSARGTYTEDTRLVRAELKPAVVDWVGESSETRRPELRRPQGPQ